MIVINQAGFGALEHPANQVGFSTLNAFNPHVPPASDASTAVTAHKEPLPAAETTLEPSAAATALGEAKAIMRARRTLQEAVQDAQDELAAHQKSMQALMASLTDATDDSFERRAAEARQQLRTLKEKLETARAELTAFNEVNPAPEELERRAKQAEHDLDQQKRADIRRRFGANLQRRIALLDELKALEDQAEAIYKEAGAWTYERAKGQAYAGIAANLVTIVPPSYWEYRQLGSGSGANYDLHANYVGHKRNAEAWL